MQFKLILRTVFVSYHVNSREQERINGDKHKAGAVRMLIRCGYSVKTWLKILYFANSQQSQKSDYFSPPAKLFGLS